MGWLRYCGGLFTDRETEDWRRDHPRLHLLGTVLIMTTPIVLVAVAVLALCVIARLVGA